MSWRSNDVGGSVIGGTLMPVGPFSGFLRWKKCSNAATKAAKYFLAANGMLRTRFH